MNTLSTKLFDKFSSEESRKQLMRIEKSLMSMQQLSDELAKVRTENNELKKALKANKEAFQELSFKVDLYVKELEEIKKKYADSRN